MLLWATFSGFLENLEKINFLDATGAKLSPPGHTFQKSEGPPTAGPETPFHEVSYCQTESK